MLPTVLLLLSLFTVRGSACEDKLGTLLLSIKSNEEHGFSEVFPNNYYIQHHYDSSTQCDEACCVYRSAFLLSESWKQLLEHLEQHHLKHDLIVEMIFNLDNISNVSLNGEPDPAVFPLLHSTPKALLRYTSEVFSKWQDLECRGKLSCIVPPTGEVTKHDELEHGTEGERPRRWVTHIPKNRDTVLSASPTFYLCSFCCLRILLDAMLK